ncbi:arylsulfatase [Halalkalibaculum sp. DA384]|uniref:arylsulfatase n=1 Tax=Halalkalibaculum sp. DA384 TaxID=3373606 RepID=UPI00375431C0
MQLSQTFIGLLLLLFTGLSCNSQNLSQDKERSERLNRPNILLIVSDDQGYGDFGSFGNKILKTPNLDQLHKESTYFSEFLVSPVCTPTRASLMTGRYNYRTGAWDTWKGRINMHTDEVTIAEALKKEGYNTGLFGKWHLGYNYPMRPLDQGFDYVIRHEQYVKPDSNRVDPIMVVNGKLEQRRGFMEDIIFDEAIHWIERQSREHSPFFALVTSYMPHTFSNDLPQVPEKYVEDYKDNPFLAQHTKEVYGMLANLDQNVGRLMGTLDKLNINKNSVVIYLSDNGPQRSGPHGTGAQDRYNLGLRGGKGSIYDGGIKVPAFFRWPGHFQPGRKIETWGAHIDIFPTILDIADVPQPDSIKIDGRSLLPLLENRNIFWQERTFYNQWPRGEVPKMWMNSTVREDTFKLVNGKELYNIQNDPHEHFNIADRHPDVVKRMRSSYKQWFNEVSSGRGFTTSPTIIGSPKQRRITLLFWNRGADGWPVHIVDEGPYDITVENVQYELFPKGAELVLQFGDTTFRKPIKQGEEEITFKNIHLPEGEMNYTMWTEGEKIYREANWGLEDLGYRNVIIELQ